MKTGYRFILLLTTILFSSCTSEQVEFEKEIKLLESDLNNNFTEKNAIKLDSLYSTYFKKYPESKQAKLYLFKSANNNVSLRNGIKAVMLFNSFMEKYPDDALVPECLFTIGYTYESILNDQQSALMAYQDFLQLFPDHELADDARNSISLMQDPLNFIHMLESNNDSVPVEKIP